MGIVNHKNVGSIESDPKSALKVVMILSLLIGTANAVGAQSVTLCTGTEAQLPRQSVVAVFAPTQVGAFVKKMHEYGDKHAFAIRIAPSSHRPNDLLVQMWREDIKIFGVNISNTGDNDITFQIGFYDNDCKHPLSAKSIKELVLDMESSLRQIPRIKISTKG